MLTFTTTSTHPVSHVVFNPNGTTFVVAQPNFGFTIYDRVSTQPVAVIPVPKTADYSSVNFYDSGTKLALGSRSGIHLIDVTAGTVIGHKGGYNLALAVLTERENELVAAVRTGFCEVRPDPDCAGKLRVSPELAHTRATVTALSPCGRWGFGVHARERPSLFDLGSWKVVAAVDHAFRNAAPLRHPIIPPTVKFAPDGSRFAVCDGKDVRVYDSPVADETDEDEDESEAKDDPEAEGKFTVAPKPHGVARVLFKLLPEGESNSVWKPPVAFSPDGRGLLIRRPRNRVQFWDVATGCPTAEWSWRLDSLTCLAVAPDGLIAVAGARFGHVVMWDLE